MNRIAGRMPRLWKVTALYLLAVVIVLGLLRVYVKFIVSGKYVLGSILTLGLLGAALFAVWNPGTHGSKSQE